MTKVLQSRRNLLMAGAAAAGATLVTGTSGLLIPARAAGLAHTPTMRGGSNNYRPGAPLVERIGGGGFDMTGTVRRAGDGAPLQGIRIQIWAHTTEGHEREPESHGATLTDANGQFRMDMPQIVPAFGQAHGHLAYDADHDDNGFETVFLRPVMSSAQDTSLDVQFVLRPA
ncbi:MAG: twin-arginine translocation pathway signal [Pseudomonadota bacterium]